MLKNVMHRNPRLGKEKFSFLCFRHSFNVASFGKGGKINTTIDGKSIAYQSYDL